MLAISGLNLLREGLHSELLSRRLVGSSPNVRGATPHEVQSLIKGWKLRSDVSKMPALRGTLMPRQQFPFFDSHPPVVSESHMVAAISQG